MISQKKSHGKDSGKVQRTLKRNQGVAGKDYISQFCQTIFDAMMVSPHNCFDFFDGISVKLPN